MRSVWKLFGTVSGRGVRAYSWPASACAIMRAQADGHMRAGTVRVWRGARGRRKNVRGISRSGRHMYSTPPTKSPVRVSPRGNCSRSSAGSRPLRRQISSSCARAPWRTPPPCTKPFAKSCAVAHKEALRPIAQHPVDRIMFCIKMSALATGRTSRAHRS